MQSSSRTVFDSQQATAQTAEGVSHTLIGIAADQQNPGNYVISQKTKTTVSAASINDLIQLAAGNRLELLQSEMQELKINYSRLAQENSDRLTQQDTELQKLRARQQRLEQHNISLQQQNASLNKRVEELQQSSQTYNQSPPPLHHPTRQDNPEFYSTLSQHSNSTPNSLVSPFLFPTPAPLDPQQQATGSELNYLRNFAMATAYTSDATQPLQHAPNFFKQSDRSHSDSDDRLQRSDKKVDGKRHRLSDAQPPQFAPQQDMFIYRRPGSSAN